MGTKKKAGMLNASARDGVEYRKAGILEMLLGMANNGANIAFYLMIGFATFAATEGYGITMALAGVLVAGTRILDGFVDPFFAAIFDRFNPKKGKVRMGLLLGWAITALGLFMMYSWAAGKAEGAAGVALFLTAYIIFIIGYNVNGIFAGTIGIIITNDPTQRPMTSVIGTFFSYGVPMLLMNWNAFYVLPKYDNQYTMETLGEIVIWYVLAALMFVILACIGVRKIDVAETFETIKAEGGEEVDEKLSFKDMWSLLKNNRPLQMYMLTGITDKIAQQTMGQSVVSNLVSGVLIGSYTATAMIGNFSSIFGLICAFGSGVFIAKWGAKKSTSVWSIISIVVSAITVGFFVALGGPDGMKVLGGVGVPVVIYCLLTLGRTGANMALTTTSSAMRADVVDYEYERSGKYLPAMVSAIYNLIDQVVSSLGVAIATWGVSLVGYANKVPQLGDKATWPIFWMGMFLMFGMPILGWICNIIAMLFYKLDRERMIQVQKTLNERKEATEKAQ